MARFVLAAVVLIVPQVFICNYIPPEANLPEGYILEVEQNCGDPNVAESISEIFIRTDLAVQVSVQCQDDNVFNSTLIDSVSYCVVVYFTGDPLQRCIYEDNEATLIYSVLLLVNFNDGDTGINREVRYSMTCSYGDNAEKYSNNNTIIEQFYSPKQSEAHAGALTNLSVRVMLTDVAGHRIPQDAIPIDKPICLKVFIEHPKGQDVPKNASVFPTSCQAIGLRTGDRHAFIRAGCGDGMIIAKDDGFSMLPHMAISPYFKLFYLRDETDIRIECNFTICTECLSKNSCNGKTEDIMSVFGDFLRQGHRLKRDIKPITFLLGEVYLKVKRSNLFAHFIDEG